MLLGTRIVWHILKGPEIAWDLSKSRVTVSCSAPRCTQVALLPVSGDLLLPARGIQTSVYRASWAGPGAVRWDQRGGS